jgi:hypothetical protein
MATKGMGSSAEKKTADGKPVFWRANPEVMMAQAQNAGAEH